MSRFNVLVIVLIALLAAGEVWLFLRTASPPPPPLPPASPVVMPAATGNVASTETGQVQSVSEDRITLNPFTPPGGTPGKERVFAITERTKVLRNAGVKDEKTRAAEVAAFQEKLRRHKASDGPLAPPPMEKQVAASFSDIRENELVSIVWKAGTNDGQREAVTIVIMRPEAGAAPVAPPQPQQQPAIPVRP